ncbi:Uncharacterised protein [Mycobacterium tuberculosis]|uniref:Uncharacterized protein n=1 Tax=Mycobacterium tuberculosis TaxID=1773 RepID=A0A654U0T3_MYCTX|nr:Uncharacterised protein [Mycobacterium tuberculosis]CFR64628.1 Uncharacterised protein [Mycobacterium tuberculosis]CFR79100.1 Uncharacterised protein [Mycobacterium tuberculosis]CFR82949.1 Uncharacterised protein [Mycobacterium tuberculosis]CFR84269.1 Uncharacterised protein [Mycobacterium tuberculosis]
MIEHLPLHGDIQRGRRLIGDQQPRPARQADRNQRPLAHAAGQLMRVASGLLRRIRQARLSE